MLSVNKKIGSTNVAFTPSFYKRAIKSYKGGYFRELTALIEQAETDSHVNGCLTGRKAGFKREWRITEFSEGSADVAVKDFIQDMFLNLDMRKLFDFIHDARLKKFSVIGKSRPRLNLEMKVFFKKCYFFCERFASSD